MAEHIEEEFWALAKHNFILAIIYSTSIHRRSFASDVQRDKFMEGATREISALINQLATSQSFNRANIYAAMHRIQENAGVAFGLAQKAVNVCLKCYSIFAPQPHEVLTELDCPIDKKIIKSIFTEVKEGQNHDLDELRLRRELPLRTLTEDEYQVLQEAIDTLSYPFRLTYDMNYELSDR